MSLHVVLYHKGALLDWSDVTGIRLERHPGGGGGGHQTTRKSGKAIGYDRY